MKAQGERDTEGTTGMREQRLGRVILAGLKAELLKFGLIPVCVCVHVFVCVDTRMRGNM